MYFCPLSLKQETSLATAFEVFVTSVWELALEIAPVAVQATLNALSSNSLGYTYIGPPL